MHISVCNFTQMRDEEVERALRAVNRQIAEDFAPYWHLGGRLRLEGRSDAINHQAPQDLRGDAILYLWDRIADVGNALGYHNDNNRGLPYGFVFTEISQQLGEQWTVTLSHEALEMIGNANANVAAAGPHPECPDKLVFHWYEMCDAVQDESYEIDGVEVSNFVLPLYFTVGEQVGSRNDFLNRSYDGQTLPSFGVNPGGYVGFFDPEKGDHEIFAPGRRAQARKETKQHAYARRGDVFARRAQMYLNLTSRAARRG